MITTTIQRATLARAACVAAVMPTGAALGMLPDVSE